LKKIKPIIARNAADLAEVLGLSARDGVEFELHADLNNQIIRLVKRLGLTHAQVAKAAGTSRTRVTAIMNRNTHQVSTDLMLRILAALGYRAKITVTRLRRTA
jgi:predicted XRE-type DNA-binding protein